MTIRLTQYRFWEEQRHTPAIDGQITLTRGTYGWNDNKIHPDIWCNPVLRENVRGIPVNSFINIVSADFEALRRTIFHISLV